MASRSLGVLTLDLVAKIGGFERGLDKAARTADRRLRDIEKRASAFGKMLGISLGVSVAGAVTGAVAALKGAIDRMDELRDASIRLGIGVETLSAFRYAAQQTGTDIDALGKGLKILAKNAAEALNPKSGKSQIFAALGIQVTDATGKLKQLDVLVPEVAEKFKQLEDGTTKAALAQELFGKTGLDLTEFLNQGADGINAMTERARELGIVIDKEAADKADQFNDTIGELKATLEGLATQVAADLLPELINLAEWARDFVKDGANADHIAASIAETFDILTTAAGLVGKTLGTLNHTVRGVTSDLTALLLTMQAVGKARTFQFGDAKELMEQARLARQMASEQSAAIEEIWSAAAGPKKTSARQKIPGTPVDSMFSLNFGQQFSAVPFSAVGNGSGIDRKALNDALGGVKPDKPKSGGSKKTGKSDEEREAEQLKAAYDRMNESLAQQVALFGQDGEAARVRYEVEHGELAKLTDAQKQSLIAQAERLDQMRDEAQVQKDLDATNKRREEAVGQVLADIQSERDLLGQTVEYQDTYNKLKYAGVDANSAFGQSIIEANHQMHEEAKRVSEQVGLMDGFRDSAEDLLVDLPKRGKDAWTDFLDSLEEMILRWAAKGLIEKLFGEAGTMGQGTSGGGWLSGLIGAFTGGSGSSSSAAASGSASSGFDWMSLLGAVFGGGRAAGGRVNAGTLYRVNERGPEMLSMGGNDYLMMGAHGGLVTLSGAGGSGGTYAPSFYFTLPRRIDNRTQMQVAQAGDRGGREATMRNGGRNR